LSHYRFNLETLVDECRKNGWTSAAAEGMSAPETVTMEMEDLLKSLWDDDEQVENGHTSDVEKENNTMNEDDVQEIYEYMSQRNRANSQKNSTNLSLEDRGIVGYGVYFNDPGEMRESLVHDDRSCQEIVVGVINDSGNKNVPHGPDTVVDEGRNISKRKQLERSEVNKARLPSVSASCQISSIRKETTDESEPDCSGTEIYKTDSNKDPSEDETALGDDEIQIVELCRIVDKKNGVSTVQIDEFIIEDHGSEIVDTDSVDMEIDEDIWCFTEVSPSKPPTKSLKGSSTATGDVNPVIQAVATKEAGNSGDGESDASDSDSRGQGGGVCSIYDVPGKITGHETSESAQSETSERTQSAQICSSENSPGQNERNRKDASKGSSAESDHSKNDKREKDTTPMEKCEKDKLDKDPSEKDPLPQDRFLGDEDSDCSGPPAVDEKDSERYFDKSDSSVGEDVESDGRFCNDNELNRSINELKRQLEEKCALARRNMREQERVEIIQKLSQGFSSVEGSTGSKSSVRPGAKAHRNTASVGKRQGKGQVQKVPVTDLGEGCSSGEDVRRSSDTAEFGAEKNRKTCNSVIGNVKEEVREFIGSSKGPSSARDTTRHDDERTTVADKCNRVGNSETLTKHIDLKQGDSPKENEKLNSCFGDNSKTREINKLGSHEQILSPQTDLVQSSKSGAELKDNEKVEISSRRSEPVAGRVADSVADRGKLSKLSQESLPEKRTKSFQSMCSSMVIGSDGSLRTGSVGTKESSPDASVKPGVRKNGAGTAGIGKNVSPVSRRQAEDDKTVNMKDDDGSFALPRSPVKSKVRNSSKGIINDVRISKKSPGLRNPGSPVVKLRKLSPQSLNSSRFSEISQCDSNVMKFTPGRDASASWQQSSTPCTSLVRDYSKEDSLFLSPVYKDRRSTFQLVTPQTDSPKKKLDSAEAKSRKNLERQSKDTERETGHIVKTQEPPIFDINTPTQSFVEGASSASLFETPDAEKFTHSPRFDKVYHSPMSKLGDVRNYTNLSDSEDDEKPSSLRLAPHLVVAESPTAHVQSDVIHVDVPPSSPLFPAAPKMGFYKSPRKKSTSLFSLLDSPKVHSYSSPQQSPETQRGLRHHIPSPKKMYYNSSLKTAQALKRKRLQSNETDAERLKRKRQDVGNVEKIDSSVAKPLRGKELEGESGHPGARLVKTKDIGKDDERMMKDGLIIRRPCRDEIFSGQADGRQKSQFQEKSQEARSKEFLGKVSKRTMSTCNSDVLVSQERTGNVATGDGRTRRHGPDVRVYQAELDSKHDGASHRFVDDSKDFSVRSESHGARAQSGNIMPDFISERTESKRAKDREDLNEGDERSVEKQTRGWREQGNDKLASTSKQSKGEGAEVIDVDADSPESRAGRSVVAHIGQEKRTPRDRQESRTPGDHLRESKVMKHNFSLGRKGDKNQALEEQEHCHSGKRDVPPDTRKSPIIVEILDSDEEDCNDLEDVPLRNSSKRTAAFPVTDGGKEDILKEYESDRNHDHSLKNRRGDAICGDVLRRDDRVHDVSLPDAYDDNFPGGHGASASSGHRSSQGDMDVSIPDGYDDGILVPSPRIGRTSLTSSPESRHSSFHNDSTSSPRLSQPHPSSSRVQSPDMFDDDDDDDDIVTGGPGRHYFKL
jgi:hypothetical protein